MKLYNPILKGIYIKELQLDIDKTIEVDDDKGKELLEKYPHLINMDDPKAKPSYIDRPEKKEKNRKDKAPKVEVKIVEVEKLVPIYDERLDIIINKLNTLMAPKPKKKNIWHIIKSKIQSL